MALAINLTLLIFGTLGTLAAFGGETWKKSSDPLLQRITLRGWLALICILSTLGLGILKERINSESNAKSEIAKKELENKLLATAENLKAAREQLDNVTSDLRSTRLKLSSLEPRILQAIITTTKGIRRETDFATPHIPSNTQREIISGKTDKPLILYGGDFINYNVFCRDAGNIYRTADPTKSSRLMLTVGNTTYALDEHGTQMIIGKIGEEMKAFISNFGPPVNCELKLLVESADRTREAALLEPLMELMQEAKFEADK
jgi:hypothetical protein